MICRDNKEERITEISERDRTTPKSDITQDKLQPATHTHKIFLKKSQNNWSPNKYQQQHQKDQQTDNSQRRGGQRNTKFQPKPHNKSQKKESVNSRSPAKAPPEFLHCEAIVTAESYKFAELNDFLRANYGAAISVAKGAVVVSYKGGDIFFSKDGCVMFWNVSSDTRSAILEQLKQFEENPTDHIGEEMSYFLSEDPSKLRRDVIRLHDKQPDMQRWGDMLAFSNALWRSLKLDKFEVSFNELSRRARNEPATPKINTLYRETLTRGADLTEFAIHDDDVYWDDSKREAMYNSMFAWLMIMSRINALKESHEYALKLIEAKLAEMDKKSQLRHALRAHIAEWIIIALISTEIMLGFMWHGSL